MADADGRVWVGLMRWKILTASCNGFNLNPWRSTALMEAPSNSALPYTVYRGYCLALQQLLQFENYQANLQLESIRYPIQHDHRPMTKITRKQKITARCVQSGGQIRLAETMKPMSGEKNSWDPAADLGEPPAVCGSRGRWWLLNGFQLYGCRCFVWQERLQGHMDER
jgi:hypothetical protein